MRSAPLRPAESADFPSDHLRARLRSLGIPGGRHRYRLLRQILRTEHGVDAAGNADDLASALIRALEHMCPEEHRGD